MQMNTLKIIKNYYTNFFLDFKLSFFNFSWLYLAYQDVKKRYRRSLIGPLWITLSTLILVITVGPIYSYIFNTDLASYFPYLAVSIVIWYFFSVFLNESTMIFIESESYIKNIKINYSYLILRSLAKNFFIFLHNFIIVIIILIYYQINFNVLLFLFGLIILILNLFWIGLLFAIISARFRDIPLILSNLIQVSFFLTPIIWQINMLDGRFAILKFNLIFHFIEIVRIPLLDNDFLFFPYLVSLITLFSGFIFTGIFFGKYINRISFWV